MRKNVAFPVITFKNILGRRPRYNRYGEETPLPTPTPALGLETRLFGPRFSALLVSNLGRSGLTTKICLASAA